jgi:hypothetical protein
MIGSLQNSPIPALAFVTLVGGGRGGVVGLSGATAQ